MVGDSCPQSEAERERKIDAGDFDSVPAARIHSGATYGYRVMLAEICHCYGNSRKNNPMKIAQEKMDPSLFRLWMTEAEDGSG